jgi:ABC-type transport system involved in multi-copper enzyme maturation permease subunit
MQIGTSTVGKELAAARSVATAWPLRWRVARLLAVQELRDALFGWSFYLTAALGPLLSTLFVYNSLNFVASSGLQILSRPFYVPVLVTTTLAALYLAAWATLAIVRPRDQGALRVLFFAPVDAYGVIGGHLLAGTALYGLLMLVAALLLGLLSALTNLPFPPSLLVGLLAAPVFAAVAVAIGLFISSIAASSRSAMLFFGATLLIVLAIPIGYTALLSVPPTSRYYDALLFLRGLVRMLRDLLSWISPFTLLSAGLDAAMRASWGDLIQRLAAGAIGCAAWATLAIWGLQRRGVLP